MTWWLVLLACWASAIVGYFVGALMCASKMQAEQEERERMMRAAWRDAMNERYVGPT